MAARLEARGPDDAGVWTDASEGIALAHRRLSIVDLSPAGRQPMISPSGRYVAVFNGEIYNHQDLRDEVAKRGCPPPWRGHSDTESLLAAVDTWGMSATLQRAVGMFAIALWDKQTRTLTLARDRLGEKPLYYGWQRDTFLFGSELKALRAHSSFSAEVDRGALALFMRHNCVPTPYSIYRGISKLQPGCTITVSLSRRETCAVPFWDGALVMADALSDQFVGSDDEAIAALERLLLDAVDRQMMADVPLGAFLSGGIDSSTVVALMQAQSRRPVKTFTIGFDEKGFDEARHAKAVAAHLGTDHTELYVTPHEAQSVIPRLPLLYDEPFSDSSQIPTFLVSELARRDVAVSLSGDAGDELFGGYNRYAWTTSLWRTLGPVPRGLRRAAATCATAVSPTAWNRMHRSVSGILPRAVRVTQPGDKLHKLAELLAVRAPEEIYLSLVSHWKAPETVVLDAYDLPTALTRPAGQPRIPRLEDRMMYLDAMTYLPDDILTKVDRAAMAVSLETRVPFLDHRVVEFAWRLPLSMKIRRGQGKWILRQVLNRYVPASLIDRPKMGFGVPIDSWLRGPLRPWAEDLLSESRLKDEGYFNPSPIRQKWREHLSGARNWQYHLWDVLMFQAWLEHA